MEDESPAGSVVVYVRVEPARLDTEVRRPGGKREILRVNPAFDVDRSDFGEGSDYGLAPGRVDARAPSRILAAAAERYGFARKDLDYMVWNAGSNSDDPPDWTAFFKKGAPNNYVLAASDGSDVRKPGEPSRQQKAEQRQREREQAAIERANARRSRCLSAADSAQEVERCLR